MAQKTALITGITGQDGAYLSSLLLEKNYRVIGFQQHSATPNTRNIAHLKNDIELVYGDMTDGGNIARILSTTLPDEIYNLAGQSHVGDSFTLPEMTAQVNALGTLRFLEATRLIKPDAKFYQASTSESFGNNGHELQNEQSPFCPESPYAAAKIYAHYMVDIYRKSYGLYACCGILFNHESPIRGDHFVSKKICKATAAIHKGQQDRLILGHLDAQRDWGHARDYVRGMWMMMQADTPDDYVLATGQTRSVRDFVDHAFATVNIVIEWQGDTGINTATGDVIVTTDHRFRRPNDVHFLCGDASKAKRFLGWRPEISFEDMVREMMDAELSTYG